MQQWYSGLASVESGNFSASSLAFDTNSSLPKSRPNELPQHDPYDFALGPKPWGASEFAIASFGLRGSEVRLVLGTSTTSSQLRR